MYVTGRTGGLTHDYILKCIKDASPGIDFDITDKPEDADGALVLHRARSEERVEWSLIRKNVTSIAIHGKNASMARIVALCRWMVRFSCPGVTQICICILRRNQLTDSIARAHILPPDLYTKYSLTLPEFYFDEVDIEVLRPKDMALTGDIIRAWKPRTK